MPARLQTFLACMYVVACCYASGPAGSLMAVMTDNAGVHTQALNVVAEQYKNLGKRVHLKHLNAASYKLLDKATMLTNHFQYQQAEEVSACSSGGASPVAGSCVTNLALICWLCLFADC